jgi:hypothetical protein
VRAALLIRAFLPAVVALSVAPAVAHADDDACVAAVEDALTLRKEEHLERALARLAVCMDPACPAEVRSVCVTRVAEVTAAMPTLVLVAKDGAGNDLVDVRVTADGALLTEHLDGRAWKIEPGPHAFTFESPGSLPLTKKLVIGEGEKDRRETVVLGPPPPAQSEGGTPSGADLAGPAAWSTEKTAAIVSAAVGVVGLGVGIGFGLGALAKSGEQNDAGCVKPTCTAAQNATATTAHEAAVSDGLVSDIAFGVGAAAVIGSIALWALAPRSPVGAQPKTGVARVSTTFDGSGLRVQLAGFFE